MPYPHGYYPQYQGYPTPQTPTGMQTPYGYHGYMGGHPPFPHGLPSSQGVPGYYAEDGGAENDEDEDEDEGAMDEEDEDVDMEMPLDQESAEKAMKHMIYTQLFTEGFDGGQASAVDLLLKEVVGYMQQLYLATQEYGHQAGRAVPSAHDFVAACDEMGITPKMLKPNLQFERAAPLRKAASTDALAKIKLKKRKNRKRRRALNARHANLIPRDLSSPEPELLPSEEYPHIPATLRSLQPPHHLNPYHAHQSTSTSASSTFPPAYPPKHTYIRSPPSPPQRSSLTASLDKRMQNTAKVRAALKNMMDAADIPKEIDTTEGVDGKPLASRYHLTNSSLVNWQETFTTTRRRWKVAKP